MRPRSRSAFSFFDFFLFFHRRARLCLEPQKGQKSKGTTDAMPLLQPSWRRDIRTVDEGEGEDEGVAWLGSDESRRGRRCFRLGCFSWRVEKRHRNAI
uniref:Uncharacterized protein n=1 Tax=Toxoplasma gondii TaxID=5811 RepID=R4JBE4_TOXGO|nr:hypothetical protein [Toxoplasma gondii]